MASTKKSARRRTKGGYPGGNKSVEQFSPPPRTAGLGAKRTTKRRSTARKTKRA